MLLPRYVKQPKKTTFCVPIGVINALKWKGFDFTCEDLDEIKKGVDYTRGGAYMASAYNFLSNSNFFKKHEIQFISRRTLIQKLSYTIIKNTLDSGGSVLASYSYNDDKYHCYFIDIKDGCWFSCVNDDQKETIKWRHFQTMKRRRHEELILLK